MNTKLYYFTKLILLLFFSITIEESSGQLNFTNDLESYHPMNGDYYSVRNPENHYLFARASFSADSNGIANNVVTMAGSNERINMYRNILGKASSNLSNFTVDMWFKTSATSHQVLFWEGLINQQSLWIRIEPSNNRIRASVGPSSNFTNANTTGAFNDGAWHHIAVTGLKVSGPDTLKIFIDGVLNATGTGSWAGGETGNFTRIGARDDLTGQSLIGSIDDLRIWSRSLTAGEINTLYNMPRIQLGVVNPKSYCPGNTLNVPFTLIGNVSQFSPDNWFHVQLSDQNGSFEFPKVIGSDSSRTSGSITATIPNNVATGSKYRIRIVSTSMPRVSENTDSITITQPNAVPGLDIMSDLLFHYPLNGANLSDISGNNSNAGSAGQVDPSTDRFGDTSGATYFGSGGRAFVGKPYELNRFHNTRKPISFSFWYKTGASQNAIRDIFTCWNAGANNGLFIGTTTNGKIRFRINSSTNVAEAAYQNNNTWHHFACIYNGTTLQIYRDGALINTATPSGSIQISRNAEIGSNSDPFRALEELFGHLDDFRIYDREINSDEVNILYRGLAYNDGPACYDDSINFYGPSYPGLGYDWSGPLGFNAMTQNTLLDPYIHDDQSGKYGLQLSLNGCKGDTNFTVLEPLVIPPVTINDTAICSGDSITLTASGAMSIDHYQWYEDPQATILIADSTDQLTVSPFFTTTYYVRISPDVNCQSPVKAVEVTVNPLPLIVANASSMSVCEGSPVRLHGSGANMYSWNHGVTDSVLFNLSNTTLFRVIGTDSVGCIDSTFILIEARPLSDSLLTRVACDSFKLNTQTYTTSGTYTQILTNAMGCDSTVTLNLTIHNSSTTNVTASICQGDSYTLGAQTLTTAGNYTELFTSAHGCDSTVMLTLTVNPVYNNSDAVTICSGQTYAFGTQSLTSAGTYTETFQSQHNCDSTVVLTLSVNPTFNTTDAATICNGETYVFGSQTLTTAGTYTETFQAINDCDSTVVLTLTVNPTYNMTDVATICDGQSYAFGTQTLTTTGSYTEIFTSALGCDSTVTLTLTVNPVYNTTDAVAICDGQSYGFGTQTLTTSGTYTETFQSVNNCDSTVVLTLTVNPVYTTTDAVTICDGQSYAFGTQSLTTAGVYTENFQSTNSCDSLVTLTLTVNPIYNVNDTISICNGDSYAFGSQTLTTAGTYIETFQTQHSCDSTVQLLLDVNSADASLTQNRTMLTANATNADYQWFYCEPMYTLIHGDTNQTFEATVSGDYAVVVKQNGCTDTSNCISINYVGVHEMMYSLTGLYSRIQAQGPSI